jgi:hypothetical protein
MFDCYVADFKISSKMSDCSQSHLHVKHLIVFNDFFAFVKICSHIFFNKASLFNNYCRLYPPVPHMLVETGEHHACIAFLFETGDHPPVPRMLGETRVTTVHCLYRFSI